MKKILLIFSILSFVIGQEISVSPTSMSATLNSGDTDTTQSIVITNSGTDTLDWTIEYDDAAGSRAMDPSAHNTYNQFLEVAKGEDDPRRGLRVTRGAGGPDNFGYTWRDSNEPGGPEFDWEDIDSTGTNIDGNMSDDNVSGPYDIGFEFTFYGNTYTEYYVSSNGWITFSNTSSSGCCSGQPLPYADSYNNLIAWAWDDGYPFGATYIESGDDKSIIQFQGYGTCCSESNGSINAQIILYPDGNIKLQYEDMEGQYLDGSQSIGIENEDGTDGLQIAYNTDYLEPELAVYITSGGFLRANVEAGSVVPNASDTVGVTFYSIGYDFGSHDTEMHVLSNDATDSVVVVSGSMVVNPPEGLVDPTDFSDSLDYGVAEVEHLVVISNLSGSDLTWEMSDLQQPGEVVEFEKEDYADMSDSQNWDIIVAGQIAIARNTSQGLYNPYTDDGWDGVGVDGVEWAWGSTEEVLANGGIGIDGDGYTEDMRSFQRDGPNNSCCNTSYYLSDDNPNNVSSMHIIGTDIYYDVEWHSWTSNANGGGFSYTRSGLTEMFTVSIGDVVSFAKEDYADVTDSTNWDILGDSIAITRGDQNGLYNPYTDTGWSWSDYGPEGTVWKWGDATSSNVYTNWRSAVYQSGWGPRYVLGNEYDYVSDKTMTLKIVDTEEVWEVHWEDWTSSANGGGFSYTRAGAASGTIAAGEQDTLRVRINTDSSMYGGDYSGSFVISTNDPSLPEVTVSLNVVIDGDPVISVSHDSLDYGDSYIGLEYYEEMTITNIGSEPLIIESVSSDNSEFTVYDLYNDGLSFVDTVEVNGSRQIAVVYTPATDGAISGTISIGSNDENNSVVQIPVTGTGLVPPTVTTNIDSVDLFVSPDDSTTGYFVITNTGGATLDYTLEALGGALFFEKEDYADPFDEANQDRVSDNVWITRCDYSSIFNAYNQGCGHPHVVEGTRWAIGSLDDGIENLYFEDDFVNLLGHNIGNQLNGWIIPQEQPMVMWDHWNDAYYEVQFHSWTEGGSGGGFSYTRSGGGEPFLSLLSSTSGSIEVGDSDTVVVQVNGLMLDPGTYKNNVNIQSNDQVNPDIDYPVIMRVLGAPTYEVPGTAMAGAIDFAQLHMNDYAELEVHVMNNDSVDMVLTSELGDNEASIFSLLDPSLTVSPRSHGVVRVAAQASVDEGDYATTTSIQTSYSDTYFDIFTYVHVVPRMEPVVLGVNDVMDDNGGWVTMEFTRSYHDGWLGTGRTELYTVELLDGDNWLAATSTVAYQQDRYHALVHTLQDSNSVSDGVTLFRVVAGMEEGTYISEAESGYSMDNLPPAPPEAVNIAEVDDALRISWELDSDEPIQYYELNRSSTEDFGDYQVWFIVDDTVFVDGDVSAGETRFYRLRATDLAGNTGDFSPTASYTVLGIGDGAIPMEFALHQNYPNPFNPITNIRYDLPEDGIVNIAVYDMLGKQVRTLVNTHQDAGFKTISWDATNDQGNPVSAGVYLYQIQTEGFVKTKKLVLLK